jgi:hypothetical protein
MLFLVIVLLSLRLGQTALLNDPGTPWHVQVGLDVLRSGPPHTDAYSHTRGGESWLSQSWLFDIGLAGLYRMWSWNGVVAAAAIALGWVNRSLFRLMLDVPTNVAWAAGLTLLAAACGAGHWLARPHVLSLWFFVLTYGWCIAYHRTGSRAAWAIPILMVVWCNVHGAFLAGLILVGCSVVGQIVSVPRDGPWRKRVAGFFLLFVISALATLVNPYGSKLHGHLIDLLFSSGVRDLIDEWRAPDFQAADARPLEMILLLGIGLLAFGRRRIESFSVIHWIVWMHYALLAVRQVAFFAVIAAPVLGELTDELWPALRDRFGIGWASHWIEELGRRAREWAESERTARWPVWSVALSGALIAVTATGLKVPAFGIGMAGLSSTRWPIQAVEALNFEPSYGPVFNDLNWGGYLILKADPPRAVFADDRFELYGRRFIQDYLEALQYGPAWKALLSQYDFEFVLIRPDVPLARVLAESADWESLHRDATAVLFRRRPSVRLTRCSNFDGDEANFADFARVRSVNIRPIRLVRVKFLLSFYRTNHKSASHAGPISI